jgi:hypothetical protein
VVAYVETPERSPAGTEVELAFLPGAVLLIKDNFTLLAAGCDIGAINMRRGAREAWSDVAGTMLDPFASASKDGEAESAFSRSGFLLSF